MHIPFYPVILQCTYFSWISATTCRVFRWSSFCKRPNRYSSSLAKMTREVYHLNKTVTDYCDMYSYHNLTFTHWLAWHTYIPSHCAQKNAQRANGSSSAYPQVMCNSLFRMCALAYVRTTYVCIFQCCVRSRYSRYARRLRDSYDSIYACNTRLFLVSLLVCFH